MSTRAKRICRPMRASAAIRALALRLPDGDATASYPAYGAQLQFISRSGTPRQTSRVVFYFPAPYRCRGSGTFCTCAPGVIKTNATVVLLLYSPAGQALTSAPPAPVYQTVLRMMCGLSSSTLELVLTPSLTSTLTACHNTVTLSGPSSSG
ncbi:hypothetical protein KCP69_24825 [Salmonella enterica subsp. enterica]|nr:hypothetical protein KCP69_24825 [Salmonella enterica subsp. enterica]